MDRGGGSARCPLRSGFPTIPTILGMPTEDRRARLQRRSDAAGFADGTVASPPACLVAGWVSGRAQSGTYTPTDRGIGNGSPGARGPDPHPYGSLASAAQTLISRGTFVPARRTGTTICLSPAGQCYSTATCFVATWVRSSVAASRDTRTRSSAPAHVSSLDTEAPSNLGIQMPAQPYRTPRTTSKSVES